MSNMQALALAHDAKVKKILKDRFELMSLANRSSEARALFKAKAAKDITWFCNYWVTTYNPRLRPNPAIVPFVLFPEQEKCLDWMTDCYLNKKWGVVVKCRYTGLSWLSSLFLVHKLIFEPEFSGSLASNKKDLVDKPGNPDALFEKVLMLIKWLPPWMHTVELSKHRTSMLIRNPEMYSVIKGESGQSIGRGGRSTMVFVDEFAKIDADAEALASLSENTDSAIYISTPKGTANKFYEISQNSEFSVFYYRWTADPRRTEAWRETQTRKFGKAISAQELDCDFNAAVEGTLIEHEWVMACVDSHLEIPELLPSENSHAQAGLDIAVTGKNKTVLVIRRDSFVEYIEELPGDYVSQTAQRVVKMLSYDYDFKVVELCFDADGVGIEAAGQFSELNPPFFTLEFRGNGRPTEKVWGGMENITARDMFLNARMEAWYSMKDRMRKTFEHIKGINKYDPKEMISIPNHPQLIQDLSKPIVKYRAGKMKLESKQDMRDRGIQSPDYADSLVYAFYEAEESGRWIMDL